MLSGDYPNYPLAELHAHLGTSIEASVLWQIAHDLDHSDKLFPRNMLDFVILLQNYSNN